mmetsp:Transcript_460/g.1518  ORF Transcript_460/g.1518 Transcript_460/m.1518 type:complete len:389 (-) Transcript_460:5-1171(-)
MPKVPGIRWTPSLRQLRKYASLFLRIDDDRDGLVKYSDAFELCQRSGWAPDSVAQAMQLADMDQDGKYSFHEFVALMHLITTCLLGAKFPKPGKGLPKDLVKALGSISQTPEELHEQRSTSGSSRSGSTSRASTSAFPSPATSTVSIPDGTREAELAAQGHWVDDPPMMLGGGGSSLEGMLVDLEESPLDIPSIARHLRAVLLSDRVLLQHVTHENDSMEDGLSKSREQLKTLHTQVGRERHEVDSVLKAEKSLETQLMASKQQLDLLQQQLWKQMMQGVMLKHHREQFGHELEYIKSQALNERRVLQDLQRSNEFLERSTRNQQQFVRELETQIRDMEQQANHEKQAMHEDEVDTQRMLEKAGIVPTQHHQSSDHTSSWLGDVDSAR